jgi:hypothetical protein
VFTVLSPLLLCYRQRSVARGSFLYPPHVDVLQISLFFSFLLFPLSALFWCPERSLWKWYRIFRKHVSLVALFPVPLYWYTCEIWTSVCVSLKIKEYIIIQAWEVPLHTRSLQSSLVLRVLLLQVQIYCFFFFFFSFHGLDALAFSDFEIVNQNAFCRNPWTEDRPVSCILLTHLHTSMPRNCNIIWCLYRSSTLTEEHNLRKSRDSSVSIALGYGLDDRGSRVRFRRRLGIFLFTTVSRTALGPTQPPI